MPSVKQTTVDPAATTSGLGSSSTEGLAATFPASPIHSGDLTRDSIEASGNDLLMQGTVQGGLGIPSYSRLVQGDYLHLLMYLILHHLALVAKTQQIFLLRLKALARRLTAILTDLARVRLRILQILLKL